MSSADDEHWQARHFLPASAGAAGTTPLDWTHLESAYDEAAGLLLFSKRIDRVRNPRNERVFDRLVLESVDWVNLVALDDAGRSIMIRQYRFGVGYATLETPGGMIERGEASLAAAKRELLEETGYASEAWTYLGAVEPNPAIHNHLCHHWLARNARQVQDPEPDEGEMIEVVPMALPDIRAAVSDGTLRHALALSVLSRVFQLWPFQAPD